MRNLICIICPIGCSLDIEEDKASADNFSVNGNKCQKGAVYALEEIRSPKRTVTATVSVQADAISSVRRVPVKTASPCPREKIPALLDEIYKVKVTLPVKAGDIVIAGCDGCGIDVIATRSVS